MILTLRDQESSMSGEHIVPPKDEIGPRCRGHRGGCVRGRRGPDDVLSYHVLHTVCTNNYAKVPIDDPYGADQG